jgi:hypothetical protein
LPGADLPGGSDADRAPDRKQTDLCDGKISLEAAREYYAWRGDA